MYLSPFDPATILNTLIIGGLLAGVWLWNVLRVSNSQLERENMALSGEVGAASSADHQSSAEFLQPWLTPSLLAALFMLGICVQFAVVHPPSAAAISQIAHNPLHAVVVQPRQLLAAADSTSASQVSVPDQVFPPSYQHTAGDCTPLTMEQAHSIARRAAKVEGVSSSLIMAVIYQESRFQPCAVSSSGAQGLMQLKPGTALDVGVTNPFDPADNIGGGARYLRFLINRYEGDVPTALRAYLNGLGTVERLGAAGYVTHTEDYVESVMGMADALSDD